MQFMINSFIKKILRTNEKAKSNYTQRSKGYMKFLDFNNKKYHIIGVIKVEKIEEAQIAGFKDSYLADLVLKSQDGNYLFLQETLETQFEEIGS